MGSCFADYLHGAYKSAGLRAESSPFGNIYNPASLAQASMLLNRTESASEPVKAEDCFIFQDRYRHFMFHSKKTDAVSAESLAANLNSEIKSAAGFIKSAESAVITLGTAFVYRRKAGSIVNNCHKMPADNFTREKLEIPEAAESLNTLISELRKLNPELKIIFTLSPVRHLRDNAAENSLSKAILRCAIDQVCSPDTSGYLWYFPSYEIMLDELRDYRWYSADLCHPDEQAVEYIISRFTEAVYNRYYLDFLNEWSGMLRDLNHKPNNPGSDNYKQFYRTVLSKRQKLSEKYQDFISSGFSK